MAYAAKKGSLPVLQYCTPSQLAIDPTYQRDLDRHSLRMIDRIAREWDWGLCQPLVVASRPGGRYYVIDGQHRLEAARQRGDIEQLPCVILYPGDPADEAATFVKLNQERRPLTAFALWNGALCAGDPEALALQRLMEPLGASFSGAADHTDLKPRQFNNVATVRKWHKRHGDANTRTVIGTIVIAFPDIALQIAGSLFSGTAAVVLEHGAAFDHGMFARLLSAVDQAEWLKDFRTRAATDGIGLQAAAVAVLTDAYREAIDDQPVAIVPESTNAATQPRSHAATQPRSHAATQPRKIDLNSTPSAMEQRAAAWSRTDK